MNYPTYTMQQLKDVPPAEGDVYAIKDGKRTRGPYLINKVCNDAYYAVDLEEQIATHLALTKQNLRLHIRYRQGARSRTLIRALCTTLRELRGIREGLQPSPQP